MAVDYLTGRALGGGWCSLCELAGSNLHLPGDGRATALPAVLSACPAFPLRRLRQRRNEAGVELAVRRQSRQRHQFVMALVGLFN